ncbi:MAG: hypothetical protein RLZZ318_680 [Bacteroidota bacterium]
MIKKIVSKAKFRALTLISIINVLKLCEIEKNTLDLPSNDNRNSKRDQSCRK